MDFLHQFAPGRPLSEVMVVAGDGFGCWRWLMVLVVAGGGWRPVHRQPEVDRGAAEQSNKATKATRLACFLLFSRLKKARMQVAKKWWVLGVSRFAHVFA